MRELKIILFTLLGLSLGVVVGFIGPLVICYTYDMVTQPPPGSGLMTVGWVFCFFTVPVFAVLGAVVSGRIAAKKMKQTEN